MVSFGIIIVCALIISNVNGVRYYVNPDNTDQSDPQYGKSWNLGYITLDEALSAAFRMDDVIWLKGDKTYYPSSANSRSDCFVAPRGVTIYGGFAGNEVSPLERNADTSLYETIISGDINVINDNTDNCYHVLTYTGTLTLDRVTISDGYAYNDDESNYYDQTDVLKRYGGALIAADPLSRTEVNLYDTTFRNNTAINGGTMWLPGSPVTQIKVYGENCIFENNKAIDGLYEGGYGGAIYLFFTANVTMINTQFINNYAKNRGGAIYLDYGGVLITKQCTFTNNDVGGGYGGAIFGEDRNSQTDGTFPKIIGSTFSGNGNNVLSAGYGGAICWFNAVEATLQNNEFISSTDSVALWASTLSVDTGNTYSTTTYNELGDTFTGIDDALSFDIINNELPDLYNIYNAIYPLTDLFPSLTSSDPICYVAVDGTGDNTGGSSWNTAYIDLQDCLNDLSLSGGEVWVKYGVYKPTTIPAYKQAAGLSQQVHQSFTMYDNIKMYGGFDGTEINRDDRDFLANPTYLSCALDIGGPQQMYCKQILIAADNTIIDGFIFIDSGSNPTRRRLGGNSISVQQVLTAKVISFGGGIYSNSTTISVVNSIFYKLFGGKGGAFYCIGLEMDEVTQKIPTFINVKFLGNRAARGGAISADAGCHFNCSYCTFDSNSGSGKGGAIYLDFDCDPIFYGNTVFSNNYALESGGCIAADGGSIVNFYGTTQCNDNYAKWEGGCFYAGSGVGYGKEQGFIFNDNRPIFNNNYLQNNGIGQNNIYGWPYNIVRMPLSTPEPTASEPTTFHTTAMDKSPNHYNQWYIVCIMFVIFVHLCI